MKKNIFKNIFSGILFGLSCVTTIVIFVKASGSMTVTNGMPLNASSWNAMVSNFFWGSGSGGIYYNGKVGIGTSSPNKELHIKTSAGTNAELNIQSGTQPHWAIYHDETSQELRMRNGVNRVTISNGGNLNAQGLCINGDCKTAWSQIGGYGGINYTGTCDFSHRGATGIISDVFKVCNGTEWKNILPVNSIVANGGIVTYSGGYTIHTFLSSGTFSVTSVPTGRTIDVLVVGGGGGGGKSQGGSGGSGGGGAGGFVLTTNYSVSATSYTVTIGAGGAGSTTANVNGSNGGSSAFGTITAGGGGGGGGAYGAAGNSGGSGGGTGQGGAAASVGVGTSGQGYDGGHSSSSNWNSGPGGGGAGGVGGSVTAGTINYGAAGGIGKISSISGITKYYAGGGGGGGRTSAGGAGGNGGGGAGGYQSSSGTNGTANTGGGGGGTSNGYNGGNGGSGIVIIRYLTE